MADGGNMRNRFFTRDLLFVFDVTQYISHFILCPNAQYRLRDSYRRSRYRYSFTCSVTITTSSITNSTITPSRMNLSGYVGHATRGWSQKLAHIVLYALTSSNIDHFASLHALPSFKNHRWQNATYKVRSYISLNKYLSKKFLLTDFQTYFTVRIGRIFLIILSLKIPPHLKCVATLPCEMSVS